jgi:spore coat protein CotH
MQHQTKWRILITFLLALSMLVMAACTTLSMSNTGGTILASQLSSDSTVKTAAPEQPSEPSADDSAEKPAESATELVTHEEQAAAVAASEAAATGDETVVRPEGWTEESHGNDVDPNYSVVFPADQVNQIVITVSQENWAAMQDDMTEMYGTAGTGGPSSGGGMPGAPGVGGRPPMPASETAPDMAQGKQPPARPGGGLGGNVMNADMTEEDPIWVTATVQFEDQTWGNVGIRFKGNSSLLSAWNSGALKMPFKLNFDKFEDDFPEIDNQRFFGFDSLSFSTNFNDASAMRETIAYDLLEAAGLPASQSGFYEVYFDYGEGPVLAGLYTIVEDTDDTVIEGYFGDDSGNIYKPEGAAATLTEDTFDGIAEAFEKENNEDAADWSDVETLSNVLHSDQRTSDPEAWRTSLEAIFDVDSFLRTMALNAILENWDTYGQMTHNFYLYNDAATNQLTWISWDLNEILGSAGGAGGLGGQDGPARRANNEQNAAGGPGGRGSVSLDKAEVTDAWPLIRYLLDDPIYYAQYAGHVNELAESVFVADEMEARVRQLAELIGPFAAQESSPEIFDAAVQQLIERIHSRAEATAAFLAVQ